MRYPFGDTVTLHTDTTATDDRGNEVSTWVDSTLSGCPVWPRGSTEGVQAQDQRISGLWVIVPSGTNVTALSEMTVRGLRYQVDGEPGHYVNPFTGTDAGIEVALTRVEG